MRKPKGPIIRWHGGKWRIAPWIIAHFPKHRTYVEPFGGGASVLLRKPVSYAEIYNDLDERLVALFRVLRDREQAAELIRRLELTPFARVEFEEAYEDSPDPVESARRTLVRSFMGFGSDGTAGIYRTGFRSKILKSGTTPTTAWRAYPAALELAVERLLEVTFERKPAVDVMRQYDDPTTLFYVDPPYLPSTRSQGNRRRRGPGTAQFEVYAHEMTEENHVLLLQELQGLGGMVVLSGYASDLYDRKLLGWRREEKETHGDGGAPRTEVIWMNPACDSALGHGPLFGDGE
jgi:DNA adenine methylase